MIVTAEPFYLGNAGILHEYGAAGVTGSQVVSLRELEYFVTLEEGEAADLLLSAAADPVKRTWALSSVMRDLRHLPKNPILEHAWNQYGYIDALGPEVAPTLVEQR
ncbi:hypothetical protein GCM10022381_12890 [Leifsonia kafniensis]|uniref:Uncharacterized protein n=1 Tax=Leifsonia kafniensis TaxID=475957 RepID=A0ABP7KAS4_9MICO